MRLAVYSLAVAGGGASGFAEAEAAASANVAAGHWAYQPVVKPVIPAVSEAWAGRVQQPVDIFRSGGP